MDNKAQGSFEYIMLVAGVILLVALTYQIIRGGAIIGGEQQLNHSYNNWANATNTSGYV